METSFGSILAGLRRGSGLNQRQLASELKISQALLSHYENGTREPGLPFLCRVCDYFGVTADFILGRTDSTEGGIKRTHGERELSHLLEPYEDLAVHRAARDYTDAAAHRLASVLKGDARAASQALGDMTAAELALLDAVSHEKGTDNKAGTE